MSDDETAGDPAQAGLGDGTYDVLVVDADRPAGYGTGGRCRLELVVTAGPTKGEVVELTLSGIDVDPIELLGLPGVIEMTGGRPRFILS